MLGDLHFHTLLGNDERNRRHNRVAPPESSGIVGCLLVRGGLAL